MPPATRLESDFLGPKPIPEPAYWGVHAARAVENFPISGTPGVGHARTGARLRVCQESLRPRQRAAGRAGRIPELLARRVRESITLVTALNPIIGYEKAALIAKTAIATGHRVDEVAQALGILTREQMEALLVPERLTQPLRLEMEQDRPGTNPATSWSSTP